MQTQGGFFVPPRIPLFASSSSDSRADLLQGLLIAALVIAGLYFGREVLLPLALAILLSFVLTPMLLLLRRLKVPRVLGVTIVVSFAFAVILGLGWLFSQQASQLAENFPMYRTAIVEKISKEVVKVVREPEYAEQLKVLGIDIIGGTRAELDAFQRSESKRMGDIVKTANLDVK